jgi:cobalt-zinc-cadmium efflux system membrane fusion protein
MRIGMFVTATFHGQKHEKHVQVPATAILHSHDQDWVYVPAAAGNFQRVAVVAGDMLPRNMQEVLSGIDPGTRVVQRALVLQNTVEQ